jgi:hypothetical protein
MANTKISTLGFAIAVTKKATSMNANNNAIGIKIKLSTL